MTKENSLEDRRIAAKNTATEIQAKAESEERVKTDDERVIFDQAVADVKALDAEIKGAALLAGLGELETVDSPVKSVPDVAVKSDPVPAVLSPGEMFTKSAEFAALQSSHPNGFSKSQPVVMSAVGVSDLKTLVTDPSLTQTVRTIQTAPEIREDVLGAFTVVPGGEAGIEHMTATFTNNADVVLETALKPESALAWASQVLNPATIAHHIPVTTQALRRNSQLEAIINTFMVDGVLRKVAASAAAALDGWAGVQTQAFDTDLRTTIRRAVTLAAAYGTPTGILMSAADAENVDLEAIASVSLPPGSLYAQGQSLWRLPIYTSHTLTSGVAYIGDLKQVMVYAGGVTLQTGWIDQQFIENKLTILAEVDAVTGVMVAPAIVKAMLTV